MAILWFGGEDVDFPVFVSCNGLGGYNRAGCGRSSITLTDTGSYAKSKPFKGGAIASGWLSAQIYFYSGNGSQRIIGFGKSTTTKSGLFVGTGSADASKIALQKYDGTTLSQLAVESGNSLSTGMHKVDIQLINYGANATVKVYVDGNLAIEFEGDVAVSGITDVDSVFLGGRAASTISISEIIVAETDTRNMSVISNYPNGAGDVSGWTGSYADIDDSVINDADVLYDNTDGHQAMFTLSNLPAGNFSILAVKEIVRACRSSDSAPTTLNIGMKSGGSVDVAENFALTTAWASYERLMTVNPTTGNPFSSAEIDALQIVLESEA